MKCSHFIILLCAFLLLASQSMAQVSLSGIVTNAESGQVMPYVNVFNKSTGKGTVTNLEGYFEIPVSGPTDSLVFSFIGFERFNTISGGGNEKNVSLQPIALQIGEVTIVAKESDEFYDLIISCAKNQPDSKGTAKSYLELKSYINNQQIELMEGYYNAEFQAYSIEDLKLKNGRIGIKPWQDRFFISIEASQALTRTQTFGKNPYFPMQPTQLGKRKMKKNFSLKMSGSYIEASGDSIVLVDFEPKFEGDDAFSGTYWVIPEKKLIQKLELNTTDAISHPFLPIFPDDRILGVEIHLTKTFTEQPGGLAPEQVDMNYAVDYRNEAGIEFTVSSDVIWKAYDFKDTFFIPRFGIWEDASLSDYRSINLIPYNSYFWERNDEFKMNQSDNINHRFFTDSAELNSFNIWEPNEFSRKGFLEFSYIPWSAEQRVQFKKSASRASDGSSWTPIWDDYHLAARLYLDLVEREDSVQVVTRAVWDPYNSYYPYDMTPEALAFINIYFDLLELQRRELHENVEQVKHDRALVNQAYLEFTDNWEKEQKQYLFEVSKGKNTEALKRWNKKVKRELGIDNMELFEVKESN